MLALLAAGCDGNDDDEESGGGGYTEQTYDEGCTVDHPNLLSVDTPGYIVACSTGDGLSLHVKNVSSHVLKLWSASDATTNLALDEAGTDSPGLEAARSLTGYGWYEAQQTFVLSFGQSLTATSDSPVSLRFKPDLYLTLLGNTARYYAEWASSLLKTRGQALAKRVSNCATSAAQVVNNGASVDTLLRSAWDAYDCKLLVTDVLREKGANPTVELPYARTQIRQIAKPVLQDELISFAAKLIKAVR